MAEVKKFEITEVRTLCAARVGWWGHDWSPAEVMRMRVEGRLCGEEGNSIAQPALIFEELCCEE